MSGLVLLVIVVAGSTIYAVAQEGDKMTVLVPEEAKAKMVNFINDNLMQAGSEVSIKEFNRDKGLYKAVVNIPQGEEVTSYMTLDGSQFFPQAYDIAEIEEQRQAQEETQGSAQQPATPDVPKQETPQVEMFVMSHCPYGTQIEKGMLPVLETLGDDMEFELKFVDYAMHGEKELREQMNQYCIQENEPDKLVPYLECFLEADDGEGCLDEAGINRSQLDSCVSDVDAEYSIMEQFADKSTWRGGRYPLFPVDQDSVEEYGIGGSPGLVVNGQKVNSGRSPAALLATVCAGFEN
jgi:hypothetical protein